MSQEMQDTLQKHEDAGTMDDPQCEAIIGELYGQHVCTVKPLPEDFNKSWGYAGEDPTVSKRMYVPTMDDARHSLTLAKG